MEQFESHQASYLAKKALQYLSSSQRDEAEEIYSVLETVATDEIETLILIGLVAQYLGKSERAFEYINKVIEQQPLVSSHHYVLANAYNYFDQMDDAKQAYEKSIELNPENPDPYIQLGQHECSVRNYSEGIELLESAVKLKPSNPDPYFDLVIALRTVDKHKQALDYAQKMVKLLPNAANYASLARTHTEMGDLEKATRSLNKAISIDPKYGISYYDLASIKKYSNNDKSFIDQVEKVLQQSMPSRERSHIHFALGKIYDDCKDWDKAFTHYKQANTLVRMASEPDSKRKRFKLIKKSRNSKTIKQGGGYGSDSEIPVFIVGMPRSGTTLMEQIIASHPEAESAGELSEIGRIDADVFPIDGKKIEYCNNALTKEEISKYVKSYLDRLCENRSDAQRVVDKMPGNFLHIGMIRLLFPHARIIHAVRNPLDTCLSCYFQSFRNVREAADLDWIANYYILYREMMDYWSKILPEGTITTISYEHLVQDTEIESRKLIEGCGLSWDSACLEYYKTEKTITTTSLWQARQPIYSSSSRRWVNYANHIVSLANKLHQYLDEDDIAEFNKQGIKLKSNWKHKYFS